MAKCHNRPDSTVTIYHWNYGLRKVSPKTGAKIIKKKDSQMKFNGYKSWNSWNVSLWLNNDEPSYRHMCDLVKSHGKHKGAKILASELKGLKTPDGAQYNYTCIYEAMQGIV
jgi:hypothetical protein